MSRGNDLDDLLFKKPEQSNRNVEELKQVIENIPYPHADITITSYSEYSDNTPQKYLHKLVHTEANESHHPKQKRHRTVTDAYATDSDGDQKKQKLQQQQQIQEQKPPIVQSHQQDFFASGGSYLESMTPQRMNKIVDWSKQHITPGDGKNIFPQVIAPSIEFSNENSLSLQFKTSEIDQKKNQILNPQNINNNKSRLENKIWDKQKKYMESEILHYKKQVKTLERDKSEINQKLEEKEEFVKLLQEKYKDFSCLEVLRGKNLELSKQQIRTLKQQLEQKDFKIRELDENLKYQIDTQKQMEEAIELELRELHSQMEIKEQMIKALKNHQSNENVEKNDLLKDYDKSLKENLKQIAKLKSQIEIQMKALEEKEKIITNQEEQIQSLQRRLIKESEYRKQDEKILQEMKTKETLLFNQLSSGNIDNNSKINLELQQEIIHQKGIINQLQLQLSQQQQIQIQQQYTQQIIKQDQQQYQCEECQNCKQELLNILTECNLQDNINQINYNQQLAEIVREILTLILTKQRELMKEAFDQQEEQIKELTIQLMKFKNKNEEIIQENCDISDQIQAIIQQKDQHEQNFFNEYEKLRQNYNDQLNENNNLKQELDKIKLLNKQEQINYQNQITQLKTEIQLSKLNLQQQKKENEIQQQQSESKKEAKQLLNQEIEFMKEEFSKQINELHKKLTQSDIQINELTKELLNKKKLLDDYNQQQSEMNKQKKDIKEKEQKDIKNYIQQCNLLNEEKNKLITKIHQLEQQQQSQIQKNEDDKHEKQNNLLNQIKEKDKKNIELFNLNKQQQLLLKDMEEQNILLKEDNEKQKKMISLKNAEIKQILETNKQLQEKNFEINQRLGILQQQVQQFETELKYQDQSPQIPEKLRSQASVKSLDKAPHAVMELVEGFNQYQQEFHHLKKMFSEKLKAQENNLLNLQQKNQLISLQNEKLMQENNALKDEIQIASNHKYHDERCSAQTGDSLNIRSFLEQDQRKTVQIKSTDHYNNFSITELIQPEIISIEDTIAIFKEILRRAVKSVEMRKKISNISEIKELLVKILSIDDNHLQLQLTTTKKQKVNSILGVSNVKIFDQSRKKSSCAGIQRVKQSHRSETGLIDFYE